MEKILLFIIGVLWLNLMDKICCIIASKYYARKCKYNCKDCKMWSCVNETKYDNQDYTIGIYDNFKNVCGMEKQK